MANACQKKCYRKRLPMLDVKPLEAVFRCGRTLKQIIKRERETATC